MRGKVRVEMGKNAKRPKLSPCLCGSTTMLIQEEAFLDGDVTVSCADCKRSGPSKPTMLDAIGEWNKMHTPTGEGD